MRGSTSEMEDLSTLVGVLRLLSATYLVTQEISRMVHTRIHSGVDNFARRRCKNICTTYYDAFTYRYSVSTRLTLIAYTTATTIYELYFVQYSELQKAFSLSITYIN